MQVNLPNISTISSTLNNPNSSWNTAIIEIPTDIGRSVAGYKRGGIIEGAEKFRKEVLAAVVWLFGIPLFKKAGDKFCEKYLKTPMQIDFSNSKEGNDAIRNSVEYLTTGVKKGRFLDTSDLEAKYFTNGVSNYLGKDTERLIKKVKDAKIVTSIAAVALNCLALGVILPKINQKLTSKKIEKENEKAIQQNKKEDIKQPKNTSFKGSTLNNGAGIFVDLVENSSKFRLVAPDIPMIAGRMLTSRNKYEALEYLMIDGSGIFLYNFCSPTVQKKLRSLTKTLDIDATLAKKISEMDESDLVNAIKNLDSADSQEKLKLINEDLKANNSVAKDLFNKALAKIGMGSGKDAASKMPEGRFILDDLFKNSKVKSDELYNIATFGSYGKMNSYVKNSTINKIDSSICNLLAYIKKEAAEVSDKGIVSSINMDKVKDIIRKTNQKTLAFQLAGWLVSITGLAYAAPKITYWITRKLSGQDGFIALSNTDKKEK